MGVEVGAASRVLFLWLACSLQLVADATSLHRALQPYPVFSQGLSSRATSYGAGSPQQSSFAQEYSALDPFCGAPDGLFPHDWDCQQFFSCSNGRGCLMTCPRGTIFHRLLNVCVWPHQASCVTKPGSVPSTWPPLRKCSEIQAGGTQAPPKPPKPPVPNST
nr:chondroitin proteoglycan-2-like [Penaeus vannamei]